MKAHIARNQNAGVPLALGWNLSAGDRGKLDGMAPAFGMKVLPVSPADAGKTVAQLLGEVETRSARTLVLEPGAYPSALVLANFKDKDVDTLLDLMKQAQAMQQNMEKAQEELGKTIVEGQSGAGMVSVLMSCKYYVSRVSIDPALMSDDKEMLEDLITAAFNDAVRKAEATSQEKMASVSAGLPMPPGFKMPF